MARLGGDLPSVTRLAARPQAGTIVLAVRGDFDIANVDQLERAVLPLLTDDDVHVLVFDMAELTFMDSSALAVLLRASSAGKSVRLRRAPAMIRHLLSVTGLDDVLRSEP